MARNAWVGLFRNAPGTAAGHRRRKAGADWNAPSTMYTAAARMCSTTGTGDARNRALPAVASAPAASGMAPSTSSPAGRRHGPIYTLLVEQTRQATLRPLVIPDTLQRTSRGWCRAETGALAGRYRLRGPPSPFRPDRIAEPRQT